MYFKSICNSFLSSQFLLNDELDWTLYIRKYTSWFTKFSSLQTCTCADRADAVSFFPMLFNVEICLSGHRLTLIVAPILGCRDNDDNLESLHHQEDYLKFLTQSIWWLEGILYKNVCEKILFLSVHFFFFFILIWKNNRTL